MTISRMLYVDGSGSVDAGLIVYGWIECSPDRLGTRRPPHDHRGLVNRSSQEGGAQTQTTRRQGHDAR